MTRSVLCVIDMLNDYACNDGSAFVGDTIKTVIPFIQKKIVQYQTSGRPVIYISETHAQTDSPLAPHCHICCVRGTKGAEIHKDLRPKPGDFTILKPSVSAFYDTDLEGILRSVQAAAVELTGVRTNSSILYTCCDARMRGLDVIVDRHCVDSNDRAAHEFAIKEMNRTLGAKII